MSARMPPEGVPQGSEPQDGTSLEAVVEWRVFRVYSNSRCRRWSTSLQIHLAGSTPLQHRGTFVPTLESCCWACRDPICPIPAPHWFRRLDDLLNPRIGRSTIWAERPILLARKKIVTRIGVEKQSKLVEIVTPTLISTYQDQKANKTIEKTCIETRIGVDK